MSSRGDATALRILIVGMSAGGADSLPAALLERITGADVLLGGQRHLDYFPNFAGDTLPIGANIEAVVKRLQQARQNNKQAVVIASGDPLCYGIAATLRRYFPAEALEIIPAATAFQLAFAALSEPWSDAALLSAHARPLPTVVAGVLAAAKAAILTDNQHTPAVIAKNLINAGLDANSRCAVCENLGSPEEQVIRATLSEACNRDFAPLNVFVTWNEQANGGQQSAVSGRNPGLPDEAFSTSAGQITKREVRLLSLAELSLQPGEIMWDIGAGSGSVGIEAARSQPTAAVYAIEKRTEMCNHIRENLRRYPAPNLYLAEGIAPDDTDNWPAPNAVFIGGSGHRLKEIIETAQHRLHPDGRLVINLATIENLHTVCTLLPEATVIQAQINRGVPIVNMLRFEALNPIFIITWRKNRIT